MADRAQMRCRAPGCGTLVRGKYCERHLHDNPRSNQKTDPFYQSPEWIRTRKWRRSRNPICQRIVNGVQCMNPSYHCHHKLGIHTAPELRLDPNNLVMLCRHCHPDYETPEWREGIDYVPSDTTLSVL